MDVKALKILSIKNESDHRIKKKLFQLKINKNLLEKHHEFSINFNNFENIMRQPQIIQIAFFAII